MCVIDAHALGQRSNGRLCHAVKRMVRPRRLAAPAGCRIHDDTATLLCHQGDRRPANAEGCLHVDPHRQAPVRVRGLGHRPSCNNACVVDHDVGPTQGIIGRLGKPVRIGWLQQVTRQMGLCPIPATSRSATATRALAQHLDNGGPDPASRSGNQRGFFQKAHLVSLVLEAGDRGAEKCCIGRYAQPGASGPRDVAALDPDSVLRVVVPFDIRGGQPGAFAQIGPHGGGDLGAGGGDHVPAPGIVAGMGQIARFAEVAEGTHVCRPPMRVIFMPKPSTSPVPAAVMTVFRSTLFSSM